MPRDDPGLILRALAARTAAGAPSNTVFLLGGAHERRVNVPAQQRRALNLVWALQSRGRLVSGLPIAVIGAGVAGTTFAVAAAARGSHVWLIDEHEEPITTQRASSERYLDPNLFDWPNDDWDRTVADLPFLNWRAGIAADVRAQMLVGASAQADGARLRYAPQNYVVAIKDPDEQPKRSHPQVWGVGLESLVGAAPGSALPKWILKAALVVVATGFLPENRVAGTFSGSYWRDARLNEIAGAASAPVVVGDGDGALTELFRLVLTGAGGARFRQEQLRRLAGAGRAPAALYQRVLEIESQSRNRVMASCAHELSSPDEPLNDLDPEIRAVRRRRTVTVVSKGPPLRTNSFLINRFITARLIHLGAVATDIRNHYVDPSEISELTDNLVVWRIGPPARDRTQLSKAAVDIVEIAKHLGGQVEHAHVAGLVEDMLDNTRRRLWSSTDLPRSAASASPISIARVLDSWRNPLTPGSQTVRPPMEPPSHAERVVLAAKALTAAGRMLLDAGATCWWCERTEEIHISLDAVAIASDLTAAKAAWAITQRNDPDVNLSMHRPHYASRSRVWVQATEALPGELSADAWGDLFSVAKMPPNWDPRDVQSESLASDEKNVRNARIFSTVPAEQIGESVLEAKRINRSLAHFFDREPGGAAKRSSALEGLLRAEPVPRGLLSEALISLLGRPTPEASQLAVDLFVRGLQSRNGRRVRLTLYLFGRVAASSPSAALMEWLVELWPESPKPVRSEDIERRFSLAAVTDLYDTASREKPLAVYPGELRRVRRAALEWEAVDQESDAALGHWLEEGNPGPVIALAEQVGPPLDLGFAGIAATGGTATLIKRQRKHRLD